jgi:UDP-glucuronate decarboxylase
VIPQLIERMLARRDPFEVYGVNQTRAFCYIDDAVRATRQFMEVAADGAVVANIGNDREEVEVGTVMQKLFALADYFPRVELRPAPPGSPDRRCPDINRLRQLTGFQPCIALDEGLQRTYTWYADQAGRCHG